MAYEIDYGTIADLTAKREKALDDAAIWLGETTFNYTIECFAAISTQSEFDNIALQLAFFQGLRGYPVTAMLEAANPDLHAALLALDDAAQSTTDKE